MNQKNFHTISFQDLKKFFTAQVSVKKNVGITNTKNICEDSKVFGVAYHLVLQQDFDLIQSIVKKNSIFQLNKIIGNFNLTNSDKNLLLNMIKKICQNSIFRKHIAGAKIVHKEQNLCHFLTKNNFLFRLEAIVDSIISCDGKRKTIVDYKTINNLSLIDRTIENSFYWYQLLYYKYIYENSVQDKSKDRHEEIFDLYLVFQSKFKGDNYEVEVRKFSSLSSQNCQMLKRKLYSGLNEYIDYLIINKKTDKEFRRVDFEAVDRFREKQRSFSIFKYSARAALVVAGFWFLFVFYHSQYYIFGQREAVFGLIILVISGLWFVFRR